MGTDSGWLDSFPSGVNEREGERERERTSRRLRAPHRAYFVVLWHYLGNGVFASSYSYNTSLCGSDTVYTSQTLPPCIWLGHPTTYMLTGGRIPSPAFGPHYSPRLPVHRARPLPGVATRAPRRPDRFRPCVFDAFTHGLHTATRVLVTGIHVRSCHSVPRVYRYVGRGPPLRHACCLLRQQYDLGVLSSFS